MTLAKGDHGPRVVQLQRDLVSLGYPLPRWGVDGEIGTETLGAVYLFAIAHDVLRSPDATAIDDRLALQITDVAAGARRAVDAGENVPAGVASFHDRRATATRVHTYGRRPWVGGITGITLHQTACNLGESPARWDTIGAHVGVTRIGQVMHLHDFDELVVHGNGWNTRCVGIEMDGEYAGVEGDIRTFWRPRDEPNRLPQTPTPALIESTKATIRWICAEVARHGGKVTKLVAHRQASADRESDPGSALWHAVALPMQAELGLDDGGVGFVLGSGLPIPESWDPRCVGVKY